MVWRQRSPVLLVCLSLTIYFGYHAIHGKHGLEARARLLDRSVRLTQELRGLEAERASLQRQVNLLSDPHPDPDYVEELARGMLGYAHTRDVILLPQNFASQ